MAKKIGLDLGNREIKPTKIIEDTHAVDVKHNIQSMPKTTRKQRAKKDWKVASFRIEKEEFKKIEIYMVEKDISFNSLVREILVEKGILDEI